MKILFDAQAFTFQKYGGISRYFVRMAEEMDQLGEKVSIRAGFHINGHLRDSRARFISGIYLEKYPNRTIRAFGVLNKIGSKISAAFFKPDLIHETYFSSKPLITAKFPVFITVYDMIQELYPAQFQKEFLITEAKRTALKRADHIFSISHPTKKDLCQLFEIPEEKISVVHLAADEPLILEDSGKRQSAKPFILYVGMRLEYKNFQGLVRAFASSDRLKKEFNLLAFGGGSFSRKEKETFTALGLKPDQVIHLSGSDHLLAELYTQAEAFVYPSLYEGFGIPPLEAMAYGCPVVSSDTSSMPEIIGDAGLFFDPLDWDQMKTQIEKVVFDPTLRQDLIRRGKERKRLFSWRNTALDTLRVYRNFIGE